MARAARPSGRGRAALPGTRARGTIKYVVYRVRGGAAGSGADKSLVKALNVIINVSAAAPHKKTQRAASKLDLPSAGSGRRAQPGSGGFLLDEAAVQILAKVEVPDILLVKIKKLFQNFILMLPWDGGCACIILPRCF